MKFLNIYSFFDKSILKSLSKNFKKYFLKENLGFLIYEKDILIIASFLFISSSFLYENKKEKFITFNWKDYLKIFSKGQMRDFLNCSVKFMLERGKIDRNYEIIKSTMSKNDMSFEEYYQLLLTRRNAGNLLVNENIDFKKYTNLIEESLKIFKIVHHDLPKDHSKVVDLISATGEWKKLIFDMFNYKSEYIVYSFFVNLKF